MFQSKVVQLLASLRYKERKRFRSFLHSPYFNTREVLQTLFDVIDEVFFELGSRDTEKDYIWSRVHPDEPYNDGRMRLLMSDLLKLAEEFLAHLSFSNGPVARRYHLLRELNERQQDKHFSAVMRTVQRDRSRAPIRNAEFYLDEHMLAVEQKNFAFRQKGVRSKPTDFSPAGRSLDHYYLAAKLRYLCESLSTRNVLQVEQELVLLEEVIEHVRHADYSGVPPIPVYFNILMLLREEDPGPWYEGLKRNLETYGGHFPKEELWEIVTYAINHCIKRANAGETAYKKELFDWYMKALEQELPYTNEHLMHWDYKNIVTVGLGVGEYEWVRSFIEDYKGRLEAPYRKNAYTYNLARLHFETGDYDKVLRLLSKVEYEDVFYNLGAKSLLMKIYYETEETDALYSLFDSFGIFLRRNKVISDSHRTNYLNMIRFLKKLSGIPAGESDRLERLRTEVGRSRHVSDIDWLLEQIERKKEHGIRA